ncbi:MAG: PorV/PorQ family protein [Bacteroidetes bacterium]|nr:PorV/PorQ family protein [Bacteroidota bacterium]
MKISTTIVAVFLIAGSSAGQSLRNGETDTITKVGTTSAQFLKIGVGARAIALGGSFVAEANDLSALYWNPAGLAHLQGGAVDLSHTQYLADINYNYAAFGLNLGNMGTVAASLIFLDSGDMPVRTTSRPEGTGELFKVQDYALQISYARALTDNFAIGTTIKYISETIWHSTASATAFDVGVLFTTPFRKLRLGANMANFGPNMQMNGRDILFSQDPGQDQEGNVEIVNAEYLMDKHPLPLMFRVGLAWDAMNTADHRIVVLTDATHPNDNSEYVNVGTEYTFRNLLALRIGFKNAFEEDGEQGLTFGGGLNLRVDRSVRMRIDYAYADFGRLEQAHWYSFSLNF